VVRALVTGATGFVGSHLVRRLLSERVETAVLVRPDSNLYRIADLLPRLVVVRGDLTTLSECADAIKVFAPEMIFHLAWYGAGSFRQQNEPAQIFDNLLGSLQLIQIAQACNCRTLIGLGSVLEYGHYPVPVGEDTPPRPVSLYGAAKYSVGLLAERLCSTYGIRFGWLRLFWAYGPADDPQRMIPYVIRALLSGEQPALTPGEQRWDYLYVDDAVEAIWRFAMTTRADGFFNLGSGETHTIRQVVEQIRDVIDPRVTVSFGQVPYRPNQIMHLQADISRLKSLGWFPQVGLDVGLRRTVNWFRENIRPNE